MDPKETMAKLHELLAGLKPTPDPQPARTLSGSARMPWHTGAPSTRGGHHGSGGSYEQAKYNRMVDEAYYPRKQEYNWGPGMDEYPAREAGRRQLPAYRPTLDEFQVGHPQTAALNRDFAWWQRMMRGDGR